MARHAIVRTLAVLISIFMAGAPVRAEQNQTRNSHPPQDQIVAAKDYPWSAVGKLNNGAFGACTAVLISRYYALTAAHCLFFKSPNRFLPAESLHFVLGYENEQFRDHLRILAYYVPPAYDPHRPFETLASDWALLLVSGDPQSTAQPLNIARYVNPTPAMHLMTAGYSGRTPYRMTADHRCHFVGRSSDGGVIFDSCYVPEGFSGAPVLVQDADNHSYSVAGIHVGNQAWQGKSVSVAISTEAIWREIEPCITKQECQFQYFAYGRDPTAAEVLSEFPRVGLRKTPDLLADPSCGVNDSSCGTPLARP